MFQFDETKFVEYVNGNIPIVISVPHGGALSPKSIPLRVQQGATIINDDVSRELGLALFEELCNVVNDYNKKNNNKNIFRQFKRNRTDSIDNPRPHLIISLLSRKKLDANRPLNKAAEHKLAEKAWISYHSQIEKSLKECGDVYGYAFLLDLHGQSHRNVTELGYGLKYDELMKTDDELNLCADRSSVTALIEHRKRYGMEVKTLNEYIRGSLSFGGLLQKNEIFSVPSPLLPNPSFDVLLPPVKDLSVSQTVQTASNNNSAPNGERKEEKHPSHSFESSGSSATITEGPKSYFCGGYTTVNYGRKGESGYQAAISAGCSVCAVQFESALHPRRSMNPIPISQRSVNYPLHPITDRFVRAISNTLVYFVLKHFCDITL